MAPVAARRHHDVVSLFWRVFAINAVVLVAAVAVLALDRRRRAPGLSPEPAA